ncbi:MAG: hypothetical protein WC655_13970, partial [Candidatus Hydrogenedentales bacterium]
MRTESAKPCKSGGWFHQLNEPVQYKPPVRRKPEPVEQKDFTDLACKYEQALQGLDILARDLGVSARSLERLQTGWNGTGYTFPMRDGHERIIGIRVRATKG